MAPLRRLCLCLLLALLLPLPAAPAPAPVPVPLRHPDWTACRILSRELDAEDEPGGPRGVLAMPRVPTSARGSRGPGGGVGRVPDPHLTPHSPQRCLHRIRQALQHYRDLLGSDIFRDQPQPQLETTMEQLLRHVQPYQRHLALKRLRSFAAVMGRVFNHSAR
ncbi:IL23A protein, partial [Leucopsar rothschildi]|nr:IL23A protein [Leucopsar rothschildi]